MKVLSTIIKGEYRWIGFLGFIAFCKLLIPLAGVYASLATGGLLVVAGYFLYKMWRLENKEFNPRVEFREFAVQNAAQKTPVPQYAPSEIMDLMPRPAY